MKMMKLYEIYSFNYTISMYKMNSRKIFHDGYRQRYINAMNSLGHYYLNTGKKWDEAKNII